MNCCFTATETFFLKSPWSEINYFFVPVEPVMNAAQGPDTGAILSALANSGTPASVQYLQSLTNDAGTVITHGFSWISPEATLELRIFGFGAVQNLVSTYWEMLDDATKLGLRERTFGMLASMSETEEPVVLRQWAHLVGLLCEATLPDVWPDLPAQIMSLATISSRHIELAFTCASDFIEKLSGPATLKRKDRGAVVQLIAGFLADLAPVASATLVNAMLSWKAASGALCLAILKCLSAAVVVLPAGHIVSAGLLDPLCGAIAAPDAAVRLEAVSLLTCVLRVPNLARSAPEVPMRLASFLGTSRQQLYCGTGDFEADYTFFKKFAVALVHASGAVVTQHSILEQRQISAPDILAVIGEAALDLANHPSPIVFHEVLPVFSHMLRDENVATWGQLKGVWERFLPILCGRVAKVGNPEGLGPNETAVDCDSSAVDPSVVFTRVDFMSTEEWRRWLSAFRQRANECIRQAVVVLPSEALNVAGTQVYSVFNKLNEGVVVGGRRHATQDGYATTHSPSFIELDGVLYFLENVINGIFQHSIGICGVSTRGSVPQWQTAAARAISQPPTHPPSPTRQHSNSLMPPVHADRDPYTPDIVDLHAQLLTLVGTFAVPHAVLQHRVLAVFNSFSGFLARFPIHAPCVIQRCFEVLLYRSPSETADQPLRSLTQDTLATRLKGATVLLALSRSAPNAFESQLTAIWDYSKSLGQNISESERNVLIEVCATIAFKCPAFAPERQRLLTEYAAPLVNDFIAADNTGAFGSVMALLDYLAVVNNGSVTSEQWRARRSVTYALSGLASLSHAVSATEAISGPPPALAALGTQQSALCDVWAHILPGLCRLAAVLAQLRIPPAVHSLAAQPQTMELLTLPEEESVRLAGQLGTQRSFDAAHPDSDGSYLRHWLRDSQRNVLDLLACAAADGVLFTQESMIDHLMGSVFFHLHQQPVWVVRNVLRLLVKPMIVPCVMDSRATGFLTNVLPGVLASCVAVIASNLNKNLAKSSEEELLNEALLDKAVSELATELAHVITVLLSGSHKSSELVRSALQSLIGSSPPLLNAIYHVSISILRWPLSNAIHVLKPHLAPLAAGSGELRDELSALVTSEKLTAPRVSMSERIGRMVSEGGSLLSAQNREDLGLSMLFGE